MSTDPAPDRRRPATIRRVRPGEYAAVGDLTLAGYLADGLLTRGDPHFDHYAPKLLDVARRDAEAEVWVALDPLEEQPVGTVTWCPLGSPWREVAVRPEQGEFRMLAVPPQARGRGVARTLVDACLARARADGMTEVVISSMPEMTSAHPLYRSLGFVRSPEHDHRPLPHVELWAFRLTL